MHCIGFILHFLIGVFDLINLRGPNWSWAEMVICRNDPQPADFGAGSLLYKGHMIQMLLNTDTSDYCHDHSVKFWHLLKFNVAMVTKMADKRDLR